MPPNFKTIEQLLEVNNQNASVALLAVRAYLEAKAPGGDDLTVSQKQTLRTNSLAALNKCKAAVIAIEAELST